MTGPGGLVVITAADKAGIVAESGQDTRLRDPLCRHRPLRSSRHQWGLRRIRRRLPVQALVRRSSSGCLRRRRISVCRMISSDYGWKIRSGAFPPEATRSGMLPTSSASAPPADDDEGNASEDAPSSSCPSSHSSTSSIGSLLDETGLETENFTGQLVFNLSTRVCHIADVHDKLRCGRGWPKDYEVTTDASAAAWLCPQCF